MRVIQLSYSDVRGGAARAAYRIHHALRHAGVDSHMWSDSATAGDWTVRGPSTKFRRGFAKLRPTIGSSVFKPVFDTSNPIVHSPAVIPSGRVSALNADDAEILHLHWVQGEMLSIGDIGRLRKPVVWTLHDMWPFCGAEHYTEDFRWRDGYRKGNRPDYERGFDLNRWTWERKLRRWRRPMHLVAPSHWMAECVLESALMREWPLTVIPNPINTERWKPINQELARELLGLPKDASLLLFGAMGGEQDPRKGFDLLVSALQHLRREKSDLQLVVFGQHRPKDPSDYGFQVHYVGHLHDDLSLKVLYSAVNVFVLPSRQDNLPNTGVESLACGTPIVAFNACGLPDLVTHQETGYLARGFDSGDLARGIVWVLENTKALGLRERARAVAVERFSYPKVAAQYQLAYDACRT